MDSTLRKTLTEYLKRVEGLCKIFITDRDGVAISQVSASGHEGLVRPALLSAHACAMEQCAKLGLGPQKKMVCTYTNYQLIIANFHPLTVTLVAQSDANTGLLMNLCDELEPTARMAQQILNELLPKNDSY